MATDALLAALNDANSDVREAAAMELGRSGHPEAPAALAHCLRDPEPGVRVCAAVALSNMGWVGPTAEDQALFETALGDLQVAVRAGECAAQALFEELERGGNHEPEAVAAPEAQDPISPVLADLLRSVQDADAMTRLCAVYALSQEQGEEATAALLNCLGDADSVVRLAAAQALEKWGDPAHASHFLGLLSDSHFEVRMVALKFIQRLNDPELAGVLAPLLTDEQREVRQAAAHTLGALGNPDAIEALVVALVDEDPSVRKASTAALEQIDRRWARSEPAQRAVRRLQKLLTHPSARICAAASQLLAHLRGFDTSHISRPASGQAGASLK